MFTKEYPIMDDPILMNKLWEFSISLKYTDYVLPRGTSGIWKYTAANSFSKKSVKLKWETTNSCKHQTVCFKRFLSWHFEIMINSTGESVFIHMIPKETQTAVWSLAINY